MDDMWSSEPWDRVKNFFPDNNNGSRIMITTRLSNLGTELSGSHVFHMNFLDHDKSWGLLSEIVFGKELSCPVELEDIGKKIAINCRGLPLSIIVVGGLLAKSNLTRGYWEYTLANLNSLINLEGDEYCLQVLPTSYKELPMHLKPCFLYMGMFPEDEEIRVSELVKLWVAEGILKPIEDRSLEEVEEEYLKELVHRNLILAHKLKWNEKVKLCGMHHLLRDLCIREAQKQRFLCVVSEKGGTPEGIIMERRICIHKYTNPEIHFGLKSASYARSLVSRNEILEPTSRLTRVRYAHNWHYSCFNFNFLEVNQQINSRFLYLNSPVDESIRFDLFWNLQTLRVRYFPTSSEFSIPHFDIWKMPLLRHARLGGFQLPDPKPEHSFVLKNLHKLSGILNFWCDEETAKRIPNIKSLKLAYFVEEVDGLIRRIVLCLHNLHKLDTLYISNARSYSVLHVSFPDSLKKLTLRGVQLNFDELNAKTGSLRFLQVLKIDSCYSNRGSRWETGEAQFCSLKYLTIDGWQIMKCWTMYGTSFMCLEHILLEDLDDLEEIPMSIGDIATLKSIELKNCSRSAEESAKRIQEEQQYYGNEDLQIIIHC